MKPLPQLFSHCLGWINCRVSSQTQFFHFSAKSAFTNNIFATKSPGSLLLTLAHFCSVRLPLAHPTTHSLSFRSAFSLYLPNEFFFHVYISGYILWGCQNVIIIHPGLCEIRTTFCIFHHHMFIECKHQVTPGASPWQPSWRTWPCTETLGKIIKTNTCNKDHFCRRTWPCTETWGKIASES